MQVISAAISVCLQFMLGWSVLGNFSLYMRDDYQQDEVRLLCPLLDLQNKHMGQFILTGPSHAARKDFTSTEESVVRRSGERLNNFVFVLTVVTTTLTELFIETFICLG